MVSNILLLQVHLRLQDAFDKISLFGGKNIILFGDLLQLPPVNFSPPYVEIKGKDIREITDGLKLSVNLWREFTYEELTINQRQSGKGNDIWRELLGRARLGVLNHHDNMILLNRLVSLDYSDTKRDKLLGNAVEYFLDLVDKESSSVCLLPTRNMVDEFNRAVMKRLDRKTIEINALDEIDCKIKSISKNAEEAVKQLDRLDEARHTGGLEKVLVLAIGARVMLHKNLDVTNKLVNGSMGTLVGVVYDKYEVIRLLKVKFDNHDNVINVERDLRKIQIYSNAFLYRKQFPLTIAYAMTIHKSQGLSLKCVLADLGKSVFSPGMSYVCLSRVTSLDGLHLLNFNPTKVKATTSALKECIRLRGKAFNEKSAKTVHRVKAIERVWYTTGIKRKCINSLSSQTVHSVHNIKRVKITDGITPPYRDEISLINDLKQYIPHSLLVDVSSINYNLVYDDCINKVMFENVTFRNCTELTRIIKHLYPDPCNKLNRPLTSQWLSETTMTAYCIYLKSISNNTVFTFGSYLSTAFDEVGDMPTDESDSLQDPCIPKQPYKFIMNALICLLSDIHLMQPHELEGMTYAQKIKHIMLSNGDPLEHDYMLIFERFIQLGKHVKIAINISITGAFG